MKRKKEGEKGEQDDWKGSETLAEASGTQA